MKKLVLENFLPHRLSRVSSAVSRDLKAVYGRDYDLTDCLLRTCVEIHCPAIPATAFVRDP